jgi:hypothetical protein
MLHVAQGYTVTSSRKMIVWLVEPASSLVLPVLLLVELEKSQLILIWIYASTAMPATRPVVFWPSNRFKQELFAHKGLPLVGFFVFLPFLFSSSDNNRDPLFFRQKVLECRQ